MSFFAALSETRLLQRLPLLTLVRLVELGDEATDDVLVYHHPPPPHSLFGLVVCEFPGGPIRGLMGNEFNRLWVVLTLFQGKVLRGL